MRTLKYALLGLINREPITGYDISKEFEKRIMANFWHAKHSQVYPELKRLLDEELISVELIIQGEKMEKKLYTITPKGHEEFVKWLSRDEPLGVTPKDVFRLRTFFTDFMSLSDYEKHLHSQLSKHNSKKESLEKSLTAFWNNIPQYGTKEFGDYAVLLGAVMREDSYIAWLYKCLDAIKTS
ncbi:PadR family transcriptional regulator [Acetobacterium woodii]|uniref:Transcriptional regulator PadR family n=1 Tax=Acetobacterium woodii (strain ATCC 29683 / DSM 1030 / JCM 2381 / KCTC 1655 / WB1) TaxID=931626 RepID=H6LGM3_ACEWD|nr:PadR family transcriptional regulator [Acetobacterium woodii]AFA48351.1 transcriptional regulator PadR family [Acetobacterium woodii DSM 1030]